MLPGGAISIFVGRRLPTTSHPGRDADAALFALLDLRPMALGAEARAA